MKTPIIGPSRLSMLSLVLLAGCDDTAPKLEPREPPLISVSISAATPIEGVQKLSLRFTASHIYAPCDDPEAFVPAAACHPSNIRVFTDRTGANRLFEPLTGECHIETVHVPRPEYDPADPDAVQRWLDAGGEYQRRQVCPGGEMTTSDLTLIDMLAADPLPTQYIARDHRFVEGTFGRIIVQAWGRASHDDSYVDLLDGRRCEVNVIFPNDLDPFDDNHYADYLLPAFTIGEGEQWLIDLEFDFSGTVIDPARCAEGLDLHVQPGAATVERIAGFTWSNAARLSV